MPPSPYLTDIDLLDYVQSHEAWVTFASDLAGTERQWRCAVSARHFPSPDVRERRAGEGFGATPRTAIQRCMLGEDAP